VLDEHFIHRVGVDVGVQGGFTQLHERAERALKDAIVAVSILDLLVELLGKVGELLP
jgi:3-deoxy-D-manno-octulosonic acid (KDO) 8-phosphate synthase